MFPEILKDKWVAWLLGCPQLSGCFLEVALLKRRFLGSSTGFLGFLVALSKQPGEQRVLSAQKF
jgi:hypothetical protein